MDLSKLNDRLRAFGIQIECENCTALRGRKIARRRAPRSAMKPPQAVNLSSRLQRSAKENRNWLRKDECFSPINQLQRRNFLNDLALVREPGALDTFNAQDLAVSPMANRRSRWNADATPDLRLQGTPCLPDNKSVKSTLYLTPMGEEPLGFPRARNEQIGPLRVLDFENGFEVLEQDWQPTELPRFFN